MHSVQPQPDKYIIQNTNRQTCMRLLYMLICECTSQFGRVALDVRGRHTWNLCARIFVRREKKKKEIKVSNTINVKLTLTKIKTNKTTKH